MPSPDAQPRAHEELLTQYWFGLEVQGVTIASFREAGGLESSHEVVEHREAMKDGKQFVRKMPGNLKWGDVTLKRGMTKSMDLWKWRQDIVDGKIVEARKSFSVIMFDPTNSPVARFDFVNGWPSKYKGPDLNVAGNSIAIEEVTLAHEGMKRSQ